MSAAATAVNDSQDLGGGSARFKRKMTPADAASGVRTTAIRSALAAMGWGRQVPSTDVELAESAPWTGRVVSDLTLMSDLRSALH